jgi:apolipoprotein N-acyltransferase
VVQGNIEQDKKWDQRYQRETLGTYLRLTQEALASPADLVVWPEAATPFLFNQSPEYEREITQLAQTYSTPILFGSPSLSMLQKGEPTLLNSAYLISSAGQVINRYDKIHLVPFGEYVPLSSVLSFVNKLVEGIGEFIPGKDYTLMDLPQVKFGVVICFEVIFPELVRNFVAEGAQFMTTITNDAWFGTSSAPYQHFSMVVFRAIENRVPFARAANTGISGFIDSRGEILKTSRLFEEVTLKDDLRITGEKTLYTQYGDLFAIICVILSFILLIRPLMKSPKKKGTKHAR